MAINERLVHTASAAAAGGGTGNQEEGLILHLDANDVDSYDGDGDVWYDIKDHEYTPSTNVSEHFNTVTYPGNNSSKSITGLGFQPDLVWVKNRTNANSHNLIDSLRGAGETIFSNATNAGSTRSSVTSFDSDGFSLGNYVGVNGNYNYVAWCFKAGGAAVSNTDGTITSQVSANNDLGFSIVKYTGTNSSSNFGHGLDTAPELYLIKPLDRVGSWGAYSTATSGLTFGYLNQDLAFTSSAIAPPTSSLIYVDNSEGMGTNYLTGDYICYAFTSKRGVSKVGSYTGTGVAGNKIVTGFEPAFILFKVSEGSTGSWRMYDNVRGRTNALYPDLTNAEGVNQNRFTFDTDGFTLIDTGSSYNGTGRKYIYYAVAKNTNETSLIPDTDLELHLDAADFDGSTNTPTTWTDKTSNGNNGTISGATFDSELGNWLDFDGVNDEVRLNSGNTIPAATFDNCTFEYWIRLDDLTETRHLYLHDFTSNHTNLIGISKSNTNNKLMVFGSSSHITISRGNTDLVTNKWTHIAVSLTSSQIKMYINGELDATISQSFGGFSNPLYGTIGNDRQGSVAGIKWLDGQVGQLRVYSSALAQEQIRQNFNFTKNNYPNGFDGTITSATWNSAGYFNFDGSNDYIPVDLSYQVGHTVAVWFNSNDIGADHNGIWGAKESSFRWILAGIYDDGDSSYNDYTINLWVRYDSSNYNYQKLDNVTLNPHGNWNFITFRMGELNGNNFYISVNGGAEQQTNLITSAGNLTQLPSSPIHIGRAAANNTLYYSKGKISKFRVYDRQLTTTEITALHNEGE